LRVKSIDAGDRTTVLDALKNPIESRDSKGSIVLREYDARNRPTTVWALNDSSFTSVTLRELISYGDGGARNQPQAERESNRALNRLGRPAKHYDEAGLVDTLVYDLKGNLTRTARRVVTDAAIAAGWIADWSKANPESDLEPPSQAYQMDTHFDALNRPIQVINPQEAKLRPGETTPHRAVLTPQYNRAGALEAVELDGTSYVSLMAHNAKGQRLFIAYGNGTMTRYVYDPSTFRLARMRSECFQASTSSNSWQGKGEPLQDCVYRYDPAGNIASIEERVKGCGVQNSANGSARLIRDFAYDPLYRLASASGRACSGQPGEFSDIPGCGYYGNPYSSGGPTPNQDNAPSLTEIYQQSYAYDPAGNMLEMDYDVQRSSGWSRQWVRQFGLGGLPAAQRRTAPSNRLTSFAAGDTTHSLGFDDNGNLKLQDMDKTYIWDHANRLVGYRVQAGSQPSVEARYLYAADGSRVKKWIKNGADQVETTVYASSAFEFSAWPEADAHDPRQGNRLHVADGQSRISIVNVGDRRSDDAGPPIQYCLADHLGSSNAVLDSAGVWVNREECFPYGGTSFGSFARKRYRFAGKECDRESGLYYHGARYYAPWMARWVSCDPAGIVDGLNVFAYGRNNPTRFIDDSGTQVVSSGDWAKEYNNLSLEGRGRYNVEQSRVHQIEEKVQPGHGAKVEDYKNAVMMHAGVVSPAPDPVEPGPYYSAADRKVDEPILGWAPGVEAGWLGMDAFGATISGQTVKRSQRLLGAGLSLAADFATIETLGSGAALMGTGLRKLGITAETRFAFEGAELEFKAYGSLEKFQPYSNASKVRQANNLSGTQFQAMHLFPQSAGEGLVQYDARTALTRIGQRAIHSSLDRGWLADAKALAATGQKQMDAWSLYESVDASFQASPFMTQMEKNSLSARLCDEMFMELGLQPNTPVRVPYSR
jgi:RHS repeat-associated protein